MNVADDLRSIARRMAVVASSLPDSCGSARLALHHLAHEVQAASVAADEQLRRSAEIKPFPYVLRIVPPCDDEEEA